MGGEKIEGKKRKGKIKEGKRRKQRRRNEGKKEGVGKKMAVMRNKNFDRDWEEKERTQ